MSNYIKERDAAMAARAQREAHHMANLRGLKGMVDDSAADLFAAATEEVAATLDYEVAKRDEALDSMEESREVDLQAVREYLVRLYARTRKPVNADDARRYAVSVGIAPGNWMGSIFRGKDWRAVGDKRSEAAGRHASRILTWEWRGA